MTRETQQFLFKETVSIDTPLRVFFLCGSFFNKNNKETIDKRIVLKNYIESIDPSFKCLILEENFAFRKDAKLLNYNEIDMKSLRDIEILTGLMSDKIIILHESISTAAELGLFSGNPFTANKVLLLSPDFYTVEEEFISGFIKLAFDNDYFEDYNIEKLVYYPGIKKIEISEHRRKYHTHFIGNEVPKVLEGQLNQRIFSETLKINLVKSELRQKKIYNNIYFDVLDDEYTVQISPQNLIAMLTSIFNIDRFRSDFREAKYTHHCINLLERYFKEIMINTLRNATGTSDIKSVNFIFMGININLKKAISYYIYVIKALDFIELPSNNKENLRIKNEFREVWMAYSTLMITMSNEIADLKGVLED